MTIENILSGDPSVNHLHLPNAKNDFLGESEAGKLLAN